MDDRFCGTVDKFKLLKKGDSILVALSGGPDSIALLHLLSRQKAKYRLKIAAAHLDHGLRRGSAEDREFCATVCKKLRVRFYSRKTDIAVLSRKQKISLEEAGRRARYRYFQNIMARYGYSRVATGHTADDNVETIIFNLARGAGLRGMAGIPEKRERIIRPLIELRKSEILAWLDSERISYRKDESNESLRFSRNRIRQRIVPELEKINPAAAMNILRTAGNIRQEIEFSGNIVKKAYKKALRQTAKGQIALDLEVIKGYDNLLRKKVVTEAFLGLNEGAFQPSFEILSRVARIVEGKSGGRLFLGENTWLEKSKRLISIFKPGIPGGSMKLKIPGSTFVPFSDLFLKSAVISSEAVDNLKTLPGIGLLDNEKAKKVTVRSWKAGDKIRPFGMRGFKLLSDIFTDKGIPSFKRSTIPLVCSAGKIVWIAGVALSDDFKVGPKTRKILRLELCER